MDRSTLTLSREEMVESLDRVSKIILDHFTHLQQKPVSRQKTRKELDELIEDAFSADGAAVSKMLSLVESHVLTNIMHLDHPRFFAFVSSPSNFVSVLADALVSAFNVFNGTWMEASSAAKIELSVLDWFREALKLPKSAGGIFVSGGSIANLTAMCIARDNRMTDSYSNGIAYYSDQAHSSITRGLHIIGISKDKHRIIPSNEAFQMNVGELRRQIEVDIQSGKKPFLVVANAGTTNTGAVDPLSEIRTVSDQYGLWLHVDGAYGAASVFSKRDRHILRDIHCANSISIDPHKWLFQPYEAAVLMVREWADLPETFRVLPEYLQDIEGSGDQPNFCDYGPQLTRSFKAFKVWLSFSVFGKKGLSDAIARGFDLGRHAEKLIEESVDLHLVSRAQMAIICFRFGNRDEVQSIIATRLASEGYAMISTTILNNQTVLRLCTINPRTTESDIENTLLRIVKIGKEIDTPSTQSKTNSG